jgi:tetratricopeptide (TPR) repeat protein
MLKAIPLTLLVLLLQGAVWAQPATRPSYVYLCEHVSYDSDHQAYLALPEDSVERYLARGEAYHRRAQYERAIAEFKKGLRLDPEDARLYYHLGLSHFSPRMHKQAIVNFRKALKLKPGMYMARGFMALSLGYLGQGQDAAAELAATLRVPPLSAQQWNYTASVYFFRRNYQGCIEVATRGIRRFPKKGPYMARGRAYLALGKLREAALDFTSVTRYDPANAWAWSYRADVYEKLGRSAEAASDRKEFQRLSRETLK